MEVTDPKMKEPNYDMTTEKHSDSNVNVNGGVSDHVSRKRPPHSNVYLYQF